MGGGVVRFCFGHSICAVGVCALRRAATLVREKNLTWSSYVCVEFLLSTLPNRYVHDADIVRFNFVILPAGAFCRAKDHGGRKTEDKCKNKVSIQRF